MLLGSIYDNVMLKTKYRDAKLSFLYNVMIGQKHRMLYYKKKISGESDDGPSMGDTGKES